MGIKEGNCDEPWMLYVSEESLSSTHETNIAMYVNKLKFKYKFKKENISLELLLLLLPLLLLFDYSILKSLLSTT